MFQVSMHLFLFRLIWIIYVLPMVLPNEVFISFLFWLYFLFRWILLQIMIYWALWSLVVLAVWS